MPITLEQQIECVTEELARRKRAYPNLIQAHWIAPTKAEYDIEAMTAVLVTLKSLLPEKQGGLFDRATEKQITGAIDR